MLLFVVFGNPHIPKVVHVDLIAIVSHSRRCSTAAAPNTTNMVFRFCLNPDSNPMDEELTAESIIVDSGIHSFSALQKPGFETGSQTPPCPMEGSEASIESFRRPLGSKPETANSWRRPTPWLLRAKRV